MSTGVSLAISVIDMALDLSFQNHKVISNNIANAQTVGFTSKAIDFDSVMAATKHSVLGGDPDLIAHSIQGVDTSELPIADAGKTVDLDVEILELTSNTLRYQSLIDIRSALGDIKKIAIKGTSN